MVMGWKPLTVFAKKNSGGSNYVSLAVSFSWMVNTYAWRYRSRASEVYFKICALKNFANFTRKIPVLMVSCGTCCFLRSATVTTCSKIFQLYLWRTANLWLSLFFTMTSKFENAFSYQNLVPIECLSINNFVVLLYFWIT